MDGTVGQHDALFDDGVFFEVGIHGTPMGLAAGRRPNDPRDTRRVLAWGLELARHERVERSAKKHGIIPV